MRTTLTIALASTAVLALPLAAAADDHAMTTYTATLSQANGTGASGEVWIEVDGTTAHVRVEGEGFFDGFPHAMHLHGEPGGDNVCGPLNAGDPGFEEADADGDGFISVAEGVPAYGPVAVSLTTDGDTSGESALAVDRFPTSATLDYERTFELEQDVADNLSTLHVVVHGADLNGSGEIGDLVDDQGEPIPSSLDPDLPLEATVPAACGQLTAMAAGGVDTGAGGLAGGNDVGGGTTATTGALAAGALALGGLGLLTTRRLRADEAA